MSLLNLAASMHFDAAMHALGPFEPEPVLCVAVSGGRDSMALVLLADSWARRRGGRVEAITIDHGLRSESAGEARQVADWLSAYGISHTIHTLAGPWPSGGTQDHARRLRYQRMDGFCRERGILHLLTGHHARDQAETIAMRRARPGQGPRGLAGMSAVRELMHCCLIRPLLGIQRAPLEQFLRAQGQRWIDDPSNTNPIFERVRVRESLTDVSIRPSVEGRQRIDQASAELAIRAVQLTRWGRAEVDAAALRTAEEEAALSLLGNCIALVGGRSYGPARDKLWSILREPSRQRSLGGCLVSEQMGQLFIMREPGRLTAEVDIRPNEVLLWDGRFTVRSTVLGRIAPIGKQGAGEWGPSCSSGLFAGITKAELAVLPGLWQENRLIAVPLLEPERRVALNWRNSADTGPRDHTETAVLKAAFTPVRSLVPAPFIPALEC